VESTIGPSRHLAQRSVSVAYGEKRTLRVIANQSLLTRMYGPAVLLVVGAPGQLPSLAGQEHGRTIPLADIGEPDLL
jgi:hypothetical protein